MIYHVHTAHRPKDADTRRRNRLAQKTWADQPWTELPVKDLDLPRLWRERSRAFPYVKDMFDLACRDKRPLDVVVYTNADIHIHPQTSSWVQHLLTTTTAACHCHRRDIYRKLKKPLKGTEYNEGVHYPGSDLFAFRVVWWRAIRNEMPDMILGAEGWDAVLRTLIDETNAGATTLLENLIAHERHESYWEKEENRYELDMQRYCIRLAWEFFVLRKLDPAKFGIKLPDSILSKPPDLQLPAGIAPAVSSPSESIPSVSS